MKEEDGIRLQTRSGYLVFSVDEKESERWKDLVEDEMKGK